MTNSIRIKILAVLLVSGAGLALPAQAAGKEPGLDTFQFVEQNGFASFANLVAGSLDMAGEHGHGHGDGTPEDFLTGREHGQYHRNNAPPDMPWTDLAGQHGHVVFDNGHDASGWDNRWSRLPDNPPGCAPDRPGCVFLMSLAPVGITPAVPEPETYALMLAGLALLRFVTRRPDRTAG